MGEVTKYPHGTFSWIDIITTDPEAGKAFYSQLFGWTYEDLPAGEGAVYTMFRKNGLDVAALSGMPPGQEQMPPHWNSYVTVDNVDEAAAKASNLGGNVVMPPFDVLEAGRMAVVQDPTGAFFMLWQAKNHIGARLVNEPGSLVWNELWTHDVDKAAQFYSGLFGWEVRKSTEPEYIMFANGERMAAGLLQIQPDWGNVPPHWSIYIAVDDCDAVAAKAVELGGKMINPPSDIPGTGRFALLQDPQGAMFNIIRMEQVDEAP
ncbi:MAG: VOC family protein [Chloroflexi bacterium]|nr:MAG: VOC family protein [Chloroflexota bacterium]